MAFRVIKRDAQGVFSSNGIDYEDIRSAAREFAGDPLVRKTKMGYALYKDKDLIGYIVISDANKYTREDANSDWERFGPPHKVKPRVRNIATSKR